MKAVSISIEQALLDAADSARLQSHQDRSTFVREALYHHLVKMGIPVKEDWIYPPELRVAETATPAALPPEQGKGKPVSYKAAAKAAKGRAKRGHDAP